MNFPWNRSQANVLPAAPVVLSAAPVHFTDRSSPRAYRETLDDNKEMLRAWLGECIEESVYPMLEVFERALQRTANRSSR